MDEYFGSFEPGPSFGMNTNSAIYKSFCARISKHKRRQLTKTELDMLYYIFFPDVSDLREMIINLYKDYIKKRDSRMAEIEQEIQRLKDSDLKLNQYVDTEELGWDTKERT